MTCERCQHLEEELERLRAAFSVDLANTQALLIAESRKVTKLKNDLEGKREASPESKEVKTLLHHWKHACGKNKKTDIGPGGKRWKVAEAAIKRWGFDRCKTAIDGLAAYPWAGQFGRKAHEYPGSKKFNDVEHALGDEVRFEKCEELGQSQLEMAA